MFSFMANKLTPNELMNELASIFEVADCHKMASGAAQTVVSNYNERYASVCENDNEVFEMVLTHFVDLANEIARHTKAGYLFPTTNRAKACKVVQYVLHQLGDIQRTEQAQEKMLLVSTVMSDYCEKMGKL